jgi:hypothetical protein
MIGVMACPDRHQACCVEKPDGIGATARSVICITRATWLTYLGLE